MVYTKALAANINTEIERRACTAQSAEQIRISSIDLRMATPSWKAKTSSRKRIYRLLRRCWRTVELISNLQWLLRVHRAISGAEYKEIRKLQPQLRYKFVNNRYLVRGLTTSERASAQEHHYLFMKHYFTSIYLKLHLHSELRLWKQDDSKECHELLLSFSHPCDNEGELTLFYKFAGIAIARGSFTFVPSDLVGEKAQNCLLITRLQGEKDVHEHLRNARKSLHGLDGPTIIVACFAGIAQALNLSSLIAVSAEAQVSWNNENHSILQSAYDAFFRSIGAEAIDEKFFKISLPLLGKPLADVKSSNRKKVAMQRATKESVTAAAIVELNNLIREMPKVDPKFCD